MSKPDNPIDYLKTVQQTPAVVAMMRLLSVTTTPDSLCPADDNGVEDWTDVTAEWNLPDGSCVTIDQYGTTSDGVLTQFRYSPREECGQ